MGHLAMLIALAVAAGLTAGAWWLDQRILRCGTVWRTVPAAGLLAIGAWVATLIPLAIWLRVPGAYGPVQYWGDAGVSFIMGARTLALFLMLLGMLFGAATAVLTLVSLFFRATSSRWLRLILPVLAGGFYAVAYYLFGTYEFFPTA